MYLKSMIYPQNALESSHTSVLVDQVRPRRLMETHDCGRARNLRQRDAVRSVSRI